VITINLRVAEKIIKSCLLIALASCVPQGQLLVTGTQDSGPLPQGDSQAIQEDAVSAPGDAQAEDATTTPDAGFLDSSTMLDAGKDPCPDGMVCVESFPFIHSFSTSSQNSSLDQYACAPNTNESGPEVIYRLQLHTAGFLSAAVYDGDNVDVDVHILSSLSASDCLDRGHHHARADVEPGVYYVIVDSFANSTRDFAGDYEVRIGFTNPSNGPCDMEAGVMERVRDNGDHLAMPATGPIVMEAHLVTQSEPEPYPSTSTDELEDHYALSQSETGFVMYRQQNWAPLEGGNFYGAGISSPALFPVLHEHWYVNMYWTRSSRPTRGTRMILKQPNSNRAVVVAAGYETGPGNLAHIGGTPEETHFYLHSGHRTELTLGIATDQTLPFGPRHCR